MSKKKNNELENKDTEKVTLPTEQTGEEITQSVNPEANELDKENKDTENEQEPGANEGENDSVNNPDENQDNSDSQNEPEAKEVILKVEVNFTDKYDKSIKYKKGKEYPFTAERAKELLNDKRGLVSEVK